MNVLSISAPRLLRLLLLLRFSLILMIIVSKLPFPFSRSFAIGSEMKMELRGVFWLLSVLWQSKAWDH